MREGKSEEKMIVSLFLVLFSVYVEQHKQRERTRKTEKRRERERQREKYYGQYLCDRNEQKCLFQSAVLRTICTYVIRTTGKDKNFYSDNGRAPTGIVIVPNEFGPMLIHRNAISHKPF